MINASEIALSRYLVFTAKGMSTRSYPCPDEYALVAQAKYYNCTPWDLLEQSVWWRYKATELMNAEASAREQLKGQ